MSMMVWVELNDAGTPVRIFRSKKAAWAFGLERITKMTRPEAVYAIRRQIFYRSEGFCELCMAILTEQSGHMHERKHRGKGGEISLENSVFICPKCHKYAHRDRAPRFTKKNLTSE